jgi:hypothetical protein
MVFDEVIFNKMSDPPFVTFQSLNNLKSRKAFLSFNLDYPPAAVNKQSNKKFFVVSSQSIDK